ncbi:MAG: hypothetical protein JKY00_04770 [Roseicyclus sp.]|nr:hypothetical protein [Roseicyclus sp.]
MTRGQLNRKMVIPALIVAAGIVVLFVYPLFTQSDPARAVCAPSEPLTAPSGRDLSLCEALFEVQPSGETWAVIRVVDPDLPSAGGATTQGDHDWVCETWGFAALEVGPRPTRIIVQIMATAFERGEPSPGINQSIEAYSESGGTCIWELL